MLCPSAASLATMEGSQHAALQGFLALAKTTRGRAAAALVHNCIAKPGVVVFGELLQQPNIAAVGASAVTPLFPVAVAVTCVVLLRCSSRAQSTRPRSTCCSSSHMVPMTITRVWGLVCAPIQPHRI